MGSCFIHDNNLLFASKMNGNWDIFIMNLINKKVEQLTNESQTNGIQVFILQESFLYMLLLKMVSLLFMLNA